MLQEVSPVETIELNDSIIELQDLLVRKFYSVKIGLFSQGPVVRKYYSSKQSAISSQLSAQALPLVALANLKLP